MNKNGKLNNSDKNNKLNNYCSIDKMLLNFKENIKKSYGITLNTLSDIKAGDIIDNSNSWANRYR